MSSEIPFVCGVEKKKKKASSHCPSKPFLIGVTPSPALLTSTF
jgi:hypothetical protein